MRIGSLDTPVSIQKKLITTNNDYGGEVVSWVEHKRAWAEITDLTTRMQESTTYDLRQLKQPRRVRMRYDNSITADMRLIILDSSDRILQIVSKPAEIGRREAIEFMAHDYSVENG